MAVAEKKPTPASHPRKQGHHVMQPSFNEAQKKQSRLKSRLCIVTNDPA